MSEKTTTEGLSGQYTIGLALFRNMTKGFSSCCVFLFSGATYFLIPLRDVVYFHEPEICAVLRL